MSKIVGTIISLLVDHFVESSPILMWLSPMSLFIYAELLLFIRNMEATETDSPKSIINSIGEPSSFEVIRFLKISLIIS